MSVNILTRPPPAAQAAAMAAPPPWMVLLSVTATVHLTVAAYPLPGGRRAEGWRLRCHPDAREISFRKNRIRGSLQSKVGEGFRVGRGGRSLGACRARFGLDGNFGATASRRAKSPESSPTR